jgi:hypothetical protein
MAAHIIDVIVAALGVALVVGVAVTVALVARDRPAQPARKHPDPYRVRGRSMRGWQASALREIRRAGRQHGTRGR